MRLTWEPTLKHSLGIFLGLCLSCSGASSDSSTNPASDSGVSSAVGSDLYASHCSGCHGSAGEGADEGPELTHTAHKEDDQIIQVILEGKGSMQPVDVTESEAQRIVDHLRELFPPD